MKKKLVLFISILAVIFLIGFKIYSDALSIIKHPFITQDKTIEIKVNNGDSLNNIINSLYEDKKIGNFYLIKWYIKKQNLVTSIKPGDYSISTNATVEDFIAALSSDKYNSNLVSVTIPEGYDVDKIAALLQDKQVINKEDFINAVNSYNLPSYIKKDSKRKYELEGFLFPDTYQLTKGMEANDIINIMLKNFDRVIKDIEKKDNITLTADELNEKITMASIVEREAELAGERPTVASVFYNRISKNMKLQSCATVEYVLGVHKTVYSDKDISVQSPFNTYMVSGLPAGPICNPGEASIEASIKPASTNYLYFVSKFDGTKAHFFSDNYDKFLKDKKTSEINLSKMNK